LRPYKFCYNKFFTHTLWDSYVIDLFFLSFVWSE
jgi:hypothetical protein